MTDKTDAERAQELKAKVRMHLEAVCDVMDEARLSGLTLNFQVGVQVNSDTGSVKSVVQSIAVTRVL